jgi:paraquat-inducible protein A
MLTAGWEGVGKGLVTADAAGLVACHECGLLMRRSVATGPIRCPRCNARLHRRKPHALARTWALLIASVLLYLPANLLPVMTVVSLGRSQSDTILSGVIHLLGAGMWPLALLVFFASIVVPMLKLGVLALLLVSVQRRSDWRPRDRARLFRLTQVVGRWSMVDIFVITILAALVQLGEIATIQAGAGASAFGAVVVLTMFASHAFDPRLIWDVLEDRDGIGGCEKFDGRNRPAVFSQPLTPGS